MSKRIAAKGSSEAFLREHIGFSGTECLLWPFRKRRTGYGLAVVNGVQKPASRWMCTLAHGQPPSPKHEAAHSCGTPSCVNPHHLRWATPVENQADRFLHGTDNRGSKNGKTHLSDDDIRAIRAAPPDLNSLVKRFGVSKGCVSKIRSGSRWAHVQ
jgi:hypothetical protein